MISSLFDHRCRCEIEKKPKTLSEGRPLKYPYLNEVLSKTFQIKYENKLSLIAKLVLNNFQQKYIYYAMDDLLYLFEISKKERENLLAILYSPIISLQNNYSVNFFDIWIQEIYIDEISKSNKFLTSNTQNSNQCSYITIKFYYTLTSPVKKKEPLW